MVRFAFPAAWTSTPHFLSLTVQNSSFVPELNRHLTNPFSQRMPSSHLTPLALHLHQVVTTLGSNQSVRGKNLNALFREEPEDDEDDDEKKDDEEEDEEEGEGYSE